MSADPLTLADLARLRQGVYRLLALLSLPPDERRWQKAAALAHDLRAAGPALATFAFFVPLRLVLEAIDGTRGGAPLAAEHARLFGRSGRDGAVCPPHECRYAGGTGLDDGFVMAQLEHVHRRAGLRLAPSGHERPDHVAVELELMAYLCAREEDAWVRASLDAGIHLLGEEHAFLQLHLGAWAGRFAADVRASTTHPLVSATADALAAFVGHDRDLVAALARETERAA